MAVLSLVTFPDLRLRQAAVSVKQVDDDVRKIMLDMVDTMRHDEGIGLAANQVGILKRILVVDIADSDDENRPAGFYPFMIADPEILWSSQEKVPFEEGCLSLPREKVQIIRPKAIKFKYIDFNNQEQILQSSGLLARVVQHEIDHLNGKLVIDYLSKLKKDMAANRLTKLKTHKVA